MKTHPLNPVFDRLWKARLEPASDFTIFLSRNPQAGSLFASVRPWAVWRYEPIWSKFRSVLERRWIPQSTAKARAGEATLLEDLFGGDDDLGHTLFRVMHWHHQRPWDRTALSPGDMVRAEALANYAIATGSQYRNFGGSDPPLSLALKLRCPALELILYPMAAKIPLVTTRYYLQLLPHCAFNAIRRSSHPLADSIISQLYDLMFLQQKTGLTLLNYLTLANAIRRTKADALITRHELDQIMTVDALVPYLKATIEKTMSLLATIFELRGVDEKKTHKARLSMLEGALPASVKETFYAQLLLDMVQSENFSEVDRYRTGLLHKRGIAKLQPHSYVGVDPLQLPDLVIFSDLHEQHAKNTAALIAVLAILADDLVRRDPPEDPPALMRELMELRHLKLWCERENE